MVLDLEPPRKVGVERERGRRPWRDLPLQVVPVRVNLGRGPLGRYPEPHPVPLSDLDRALGTVLYGKLDGPLARRPGGGSAGFLGAQHA